MDLNVCLSLFPSQSFKSGVERKWATEHVDYCNVRDDLSSFMMDNDRASLKSPRRPLWLY